MNVTSRLPASHPTRVFVPYLSDHAYAMAGVFRSLGVEAEVLPKSGDESMEIGLSLCRGRECLPCFLCIGDMLLRCRQPDFDFENWAFVMPRGPGPCRFGQYNVLQKQILKEQGYPNVRIESPTSRDSYMLFGASPRVLRMRSSHAVIAVDLLGKLLHAHRPYEIHEGTSDELYDRCLKHVVEGAEAGAGRHIEAALKWCADRFMELPVDRSVRRPLVAVIGELYLMLNARSNAEIVRKVEAAGGEVMHGTFMDYLHFVDWKRRKLDIEFSDWRDYVKGTVTDWYQQYWQARLFRAIRKAIPHGPETPIRRAMRSLSPHYDPLLGTEAVLTQARALELYKERVAGYINVLPFSCMPGTISAAMAPVIRGDMDGVPWLDIAYDGQEDTNIHTRLEAFMHQVGQFDRRVVRKGSDGEMGEGSGIDREPSSPPARPLSWRRLARGSITFAALTLAGLAALAFWSRSSGDTAQADLQSGWLVLAGVVAVLEVLIASGRYHVLVRRLQPGARFRDAVAAMLANRFAASVTPSQTGGGPALLFVLNRAGLPVAHGVSVVAVNFLLTMTAMTGVAMTGVWYLRESLGSGAMQLFLQYAVVVGLALFLLVVVALLRPHIVVRPLGRWQTRVRPGGRASRLLGAMVNGAETYRKGARHLLRHSPSALCGASVLTIGLFAAKYFLAYVILLGLGLRAELGLVLAIQAVLHFVIYLAPSPGGSGVAEVGTGALMTLVMPVGLVGLFTVVYRGLLIYLPAIAGSLALVQSTRRKAGRTAESVSGTSPIADPALSTPVRGGVLAAAIGALLLVEPAAAGVTPGRCERLYMSGQTEASVACYESRSPDRDTRIGLIRGLNDLSMKWAHDGRIEKAEESARRASAMAESMVADFPGDAEAWFYAAASVGSVAVHVGGRSKVEIGHRVEAYCIRSLSLDPESPLPHIVLGMYYREIAELNPLERGLARLMYGPLPRGSKERAIQHLRAAVKADPSLRVARYQLAKTLDVFGRYSDAVEHYRISLSLPLLNARDRRNAVLAEQRVRELGA